jgi:hypothetical protein
MQSSKKFAFDIGLSFIASVISIPIGFIISIFLGRYLGAGELGLYYMNSTIYGIALLFAGIGIPGAMIKYLAEFREDRKRSNMIVSSGIITSLFLGIGFSVLFYLTAGFFESLFNMPGLAILGKNTISGFPICSSERNVARVAQREKGNEKICIYDHRPERLDDGYICSIALVGFWRQRRSNWCCSGYHRVVPVSGTGQQELF